MALKEKLNELIKNAMLKRDQIELDTLRDIKTKFTEFETSKGAPVLTEVDEFRILNKMYKGRVENSETYYNNGRPDLGLKELMESYIIEVFLPKEVPTDEIEKFVVSIKPFNKKEMGITISKVKSKYPTVDGKVIADIVKRHIDS